MKYSQSTNCFTGVKSWLTEEQCKRRDKAKLAELMRLEATGEILDGSTWDNLCPRCESLIPPNLQIKSSGASGGSGAKDGPYHYNITHCMCQGCGFRFRTVDRMKDYLRLYCGVN